MWIMKLEGIGKMAFTTILSNHKEVDLNIFKKYKDLRLPIIFFRM
jgi:hypothetical protein